MGWMRLNQSLKQVKTRCLQRWYICSLLPIFILIAAVNGIAWMQAWSMTNYVAGRSRTMKPEQMTLVDKLKVVLTGVEVPRPVNSRTPAAIALPYETHHLTLPNQAVLEAWFVPAKNPRGVVILFPPYAASKAVLLSPAKQFHDLGYSTFLVDFRGTGGSSGSDTTLGVREAEDVKAAIAYVNQHWANRPVILYGASMGAVAIMRAIAHEQVAADAVILESPFDRLLNTIGHRFEAMRIPKFPSAELLVFWGSVQQNIDGFAHDPIDYAKAIKVPVLLLHGEADARVTIQDVNAIFANLAGRKELVIFPDEIGHGSLAEGDPVRWQHAVQMFLENRQR